MKGKKKKELKIEKHTNNNNKAWLSEKFYRVSHIQSSNSNTLPGLNRHDSK